MSIRYKTILWSLLLILIAFILIVLYYKLVTVKSIAEVETKNLETDLQREINLINQNIKTLETLGKDWAARDDIYRFVQDRNQDFINSNIVPSMFNSLAINYVIILDLNGEVVSAGGHDLERDRLIPVPDDLIDTLKKDSLLMNRVARGNSISGIISISGRQVIITASPILTSSGDGPAQGVVVLGKNINKTIIETFGLSHEMRLSIVTLEQAPETTYSLIYNNKRYISEINNDKIIAYSLIYDLYNKPAFIIRLEITRDIYKQVSKTMRKFLYIMFSIIGFLSIIGYLLMEKLLISKIVALSKNVAVIGSSGDVSLRIEVKGKDELAFLAREINTMLGKLEDSQMDLRKNEEQFKYLSFHDKLTEVYNRAFLDQELKKMHTEIYMPLSIIMGDVNGLKFVNDALGHLYGDKILVEIAKTIKTVCRESDIITRWGGDEFLILLPKTNEAAASEIAEKINEACKRAKVGRIQLGISLGVATKNDLSEDFEDVLKYAEDRMYRNKLLRQNSYRSSLLSSLEKTLWEKSRETEEHCRRILEIATGFGSYLGLSGSQMDELKLLATLHDIGKVAIPNEILNKNIPLSDTEWQLLKKHPEIGFRIAQSTPGMTPIAEAILTHHERWDGTGYPLGIKEDSIPLISRIIAVIDAYDVMMLGRSYSAPRSREEIIAELGKQSGTQFDPEIVNRFAEYFLSWEINKKA